MKPFPALLTARILILFLACASFPAPRAHGAEPTLVFGYNSPGYPPYLMETDKGITGITHAILTQALAGMGWKLRVVLHPERRGQLLLDQDQVDARGKAMEWVSNPGDYWWSEPFLTSRELLVSRTEDALGDMNPETLRGRSIAALHGFHHPELEPALASGTARRVDVYTVHKQLFLLCMGRVDGALMDNLTLHWLVREYPQYQPQMFFFVPTGTDEMHYRLMFSKKRDWRPFIQRFDQRIQEMRASGAIAGILAAYR